MKIVVDTNVVISGTFFKGLPRKVIEAISDNKFDAFVTTEIVAEYKEVVSEMINRKQGNLDRNILDYFISKLSFVEKSLM